MSSAASIGALDPDSRALTTAGHWLEHRRRELQRVVDPGDAGPLAKELDRVESALAWLDAGVYGHCRVCGATLDRDVIERDPAGMVCASCAETSRRYRSRLRSSTEARRSRCPEVVSLNDGPDELDRQFRQASAQSTVS